MIQPEVRRVASITSTMSATPKIMSQVSGLVLRSVNASPLQIIQPITASDSSASSTSHHMRRWRKRFATGNIMNDRKRTSATWTPRSSSVRTIP